VPLDASVGIGFVAVALLLRRAPLVMRLWWAAMSGAWWLGNLSELRVVHQGVLVAALACFPTGRPETMPQRAMLGVGALAASGLTGQAGAAIAFLATALVSVRKPFARTVAVAVALVLAGLFIWSRAWPAGFNPSAALAGYQVVMLVVALALPWGVAVERHRRTAMTDRVLATGEAGLPGLEAALRTALKKPGLRLTRSSDGVAIEGLGHVDAETASAVDRAVSLTMAHGRALAEAAHQFAELQDARRRLLAAADAERALAGQRLRRQLTVLRACEADVATLHDVALEIRAAVEEIERITAGLPPTGLGNGGIRAALTELCAQHPVPASLDLDPNAAADLASETALFYVCSEALANSAKHAGASNVVVRLGGGEELNLTVCDDGVGGADASGGGLSGLRDRLASIGGSLSVESAAGLGTRISARVPNATVG
jgi:signal transduction histidine kinase